MSSAKLAALLQQAAQFQAQAEKYDLDFRNQVINTRPDAKNFAFSEVANVVLQDLTSLDREEKDPAITAATHAIMTILNSFAVPDPNALLNAANQSAAAIRSKANDPKKLQVANYFVSLAQLLVNKFFHTAQEGEQPQATEGSLQFVQRMHAALKNNKPVSEADKAKWNAGKSIYLRRLNALNAMGQRTPPQEQERLALQFVSDKMQTQIG
jgi:hypothetical protein